MHRLKCQSLGVTMKLPEASKIHKWNFKFKYGAKVLQITPTKCVQFKVFIDKTRNCFGPPLAHHQEVLLCKTIARPFCHLQYKELWWRSSMCDLQRRICTQHCNVCSILYYCIYYNQQMYNKCHNSIYQNSIFLYTPTCFNISVSSSGNFTFVPCQVT